MAAGYKLSAMTKLGDTKSPTLPQVSLLAFLARHCQGTELCAAAWTTGALADLRATAGTAATFPYPQLVADCTAAARRTRELDAALAEAIAAKADVQSQRASASDGDDSEGVHEVEEDQFPVVLTDLTRRHAELTTALAAQLKATEEALKKLLAHFGERATEAKAADELFALVHTFLQQYEDAVALLPSLPTLPADQAVSEVSATAPAAGSTSTPKARFLNAVTEEIELQKALRYDPIPPLPARPKPPHHSNSSMLHGRTRSISEAARDEALAAELEAELRRSHAKIATLTRLTSREG